MAVMLQSANEMSVAVAEEVSGSVKKFAELMNWRAKLFGCKNTHLTIPTVFRMKIITPQPPTWQRSPNPPG